MTILGLLACFGCNPPPPPKKKTTTQPKPVQYDAVNAVLHGDAETLRLALIADPELPKKRFNGNRSLLHLAAETEHTNCVNLLLLAGAKINDSDAAGMTPLITAILRQQTTMAAFLMERGANPKLTSPKGRNAFHTAVLKQVDTELLQAILKQGINIDATDNDGMTALHMAAQQGDDVIVKFLLENNADTNRRTSEGLTAAEIAKTIGRIQVLSLLQPKTDPAEVTRSSLDNPPPPTNVVAIAQPPPPPPEPKVRPGQVMLVIMNFGSNRLPGVRDVLVRNTGMTPANGELVWKTIDSSDNINSGTINLNLPPNGQTQIRIGRAMPIITNTVYSTSSRYGPGYMPPTARHTVTQPTENKMGFLVEFRVDGQLINVQAQPPDTKQRISMIQGG